MTCARKEFVISGPGYTPKQRGASRLPRESPQFGSRDLSYSAFDRPASIQGHIGWESAQAGQRNQINYSSDDGQSCDLGFCIGCLQCLSSRIFTVISGLRALTSARSFLHSSALSIGDSALSSCRLMDSMRSSRFSSSSVTATCWRSASPSLEWNVYALVVQDIKDCK